MMQFVDSNVIIKAFTNNSEKENCRRVLSEEFITNAICLVEAHHAISIIRKDKDYATNSIKSLFKNQGLIIDLDKDLLFEAFRRIEKYDLNIFDLINYAAALIHNCSKFVSYDKDFDDLEIKRVEP